MDTRPLSPWLIDDEPVAAPLGGDLDVDVAIIGAGYTGLCSALELRREGFDVAVLEAEFAGFGASGRNAGHLTPTIGKDVPTLLRVYGRERTRVLLALAEKPAKWRYGYELCQQTELKAGSMYPILMRLADRGLLETAWEADAPQGRPPRHLYRLTGDGRALASELAAELPARGRLRPGLEGT